MICKYNTKHQVIFQILNKNTDVCTIKLLNLKEQVQRLL